MATLQNQLLENKEEAPFSFHLGEDQVEEVKEEGLAEALKKVGKAVSTERVLLAKGQTVLRC